MKNIEQLLRDYGYPDESISKLTKEIGTMSYDQVEKRIMPYHDITADKFQR
jgi:hypothetical protein